MKTKNYWLIIISVSILMMSYSIAIDTYTPAIPLLIRYLHTTQSNIQNTLNFFFLANAVGGLLYGSLSDTVGRKKVLIFGAISFGITSYLLSKLVNIEQFLILRVLQGIGIAALGSITSAIFRDLFSGKEFAKASAFAGAIFMIAPTFAPTFGGMLTTYFGWRSIFYVMTIFSGLVLLLIIFILPETLPKEKRTKPDVLLLIKASKKILVDKKILSYIASSYLSNASFMVFLMDGPLVIIDIFHKTPLYFGYYYGGVALIICAVSISVGHMTKHFAIESLLNFGFMLRGCASIYLVIISLIHPSLILFSIGLVFFVPAGVFIVTASTTQIMDKYPHEAGTASSIIFFVGTIIMFLATYICTFIDVKTLLDMTLPMAITILGGYAIYYPIIKPYKKHEI